jgi:alkanesulfonate monooxygenase SsuD/methylene tetrahydromethanopterin reductase-like flavin-dependent oxidoreductase (luciferase family)
VGENEEIARNKAAIHNALVSTEAGITILSGHLGFDLSTVNLEGTPENLQVPGLQGLFDAYAASIDDREATLADIARHHGTSVSVPQIVGTAEQIADWMGEFIDTVGGDGFLLSPAYIPGSAEEFCELVVPVLQQRGRIRTEYLDGTLRDNLLAF